MFIFVVIEVRFDAMMEVIFKDVWGNNTNNKGSNSEHREFK